LCSFLRPAVTPSLFGPDVLSTLFSNTLSLCSSLNARGHVSHPHSTTGNIIVLYIVIFKLFDCRGYVCQIENRVQWHRLDSDVESTVEVMSV
jgi:hypothetical protein